MTGSAMSTRAAPPRALGTDHRLPTQRSTETDTIAPTASTELTADELPRSGHALLVDPDQVALDRLRTSLLEPGGPAEVSACSNADDALAMIGQGEPGDLALISTRLGADAVPLITALRQAGWSRVLGLLSTRDAAAAMAMIEAGATGLLATHTSGVITNADVYSQAKELSEREIDVVRMVADGRPNKWIGQQLDLSALTVKSHLARIGRKLGTGDRAHIVMRALRAGVIS